MQKPPSKHHFEFLAALAICLALILASIIPYYFDLSIQPGRFAMQPLPAPVTTEPSDEREIASRKMKETVRSPEELREKLQQGWQPEYLELESASDLYDLSLLQAVPELKGLIFCGMRLTSDQLSILPELPHLVGLTFYDCRFEEGAIASLPPLKSLERLSFMLSQLADEDFGIIADRYGAGITKLDLFCTRMSDAAAPHLAKFPQLQDLDLQGTMTTNRSFEYLQQLKALRRVHVRLGGPVNRDNARQLQKAVPGVIVDWKS